MNGFVERIGQAAAPMLWIDGDAYAWRLFGGTEAAWLQPADFVALQRKAQGLLRSDVVAVDAATAAAAWISAHPPVAEAMAQKRRATAPLRSLLSDDGYRDLLAELLSGMRGSFGDLPLALVMPSPRHWLRTAYVQAHGSDAEIDVGEDEIDSAAVYLADFLRSFGESGADVLLMTESPADPPAGAAEIGWYQPVFNVAAHYRWDSGLLLDGAAPAALDADGVAFVVAPGDTGAPLQGRLIPDAFWSDDSADTAGALAYARIPVDAQPERVLARLAQLRGDRR